MSKCFYVNPKLKTLIEYKYDRDYKQVSGHIYGIYKGKYQHIKLIDNNFNFEIYVSQLPFRKEWKRVPYDIGKKYGISYEMFNFVDKIKYVNKFGLFGRLVAWVIGFLFPSNVDTYQYSLNYIAPMAAGYHYRKELQHILYVAFNV